MRTHPSHRSSEKGRDDLRGSGSCEDLDSPPDARYASALASVTRTSEISTGYGAELDQLGATYTLVKSSDNAALSGLVERISDAPTVFVGSGGAFALAQFAADLHQQYTGRVGRAITPLECSTAMLHGETAVVMFTASGRHPDAALAIRAGKRALFSTIGVVTLRPEDELPSDLRGDRVSVVTVPCALKKDGFLATNSILAMATALVRAYAADVDLPQALPLLEFVPFDLRPQCLFLFPPRYAAVACDAEARLHETGLATVQATDYRNFAHGRHAGLARRLSETTVVGLIGPEHEHLAHRTLSELPKKADVHTIVTTLPWPCGVLDLLAGSMRLIVPAAKQQKLNPARPGVGPFGRRLYHLAVNEPGATPLSLPVSRKLMSVGRLRNDDSIRAAFENALEKWMRDLHETQFKGIVLDYDGTCCTTEGRYELPQPDIRAELERVLDAGLVVGFASGRGGSLHRDLRKWVPKKNWNRIALGLYNGAVLVGLSEDLSGQTLCTSFLADARDRLAASPFSHLIAIEAHTHQVEVRLKSVHSWSGVGLATVTREILERYPPLPVKIVASAHSVDIVAGSTTKRTVLETVRTTCGGNVLAIGDQGHTGGNDFEMLAAMTTTLSVDRCSADPTRCWNLDEKGHRGPALLKRYLRAIRIGRRGAAFRWGQE